MGKMADGRNKKSAQLRGEHKPRKVGSKKRKKKVAVLSPLVRARRSVERELSSMLCRPKAKKRPRVDKKEFDKRVMAESMGRKRKASGGGVYRNL